MKKLDKEIYREALWLILKLHKITEGEFNYIFKFVECKELRNGAFFSEENFKCRYLGLLIEGDLYAHGSDAQGAKRIYKFYHAPIDRIVTSYESLQTATLSTESIEALSDCILFVVTLRDLNTIFEHFPLLHGLEKIILAAGLNTSIGELKDIKELSDSDWLAKLEKDFPHLLKEPFLKHLEFYCKMCRASLFKHRNSLGI